MEASVSESPIENWRQTISIFIVKSLFSTVFFYNCCYRNEQRQSILSQNSDSTDINTKFSSKAILKAFQALEPVLGRATIDSIIYDIGFHGMPLVNDQEFYSLSQLQATLENIFDSEVTLLLMDRLKKSLIKNI